MGGTSGPRSEVSRGQDNGEARPERVGEGASFTQDGDEVTGEAVRDRRTPRPACPQEWLPAAYSGRDEAQGPAGRRDAQPQFG